MASLALAVDSKRPDVGMERVMRRSVDAYNRWNDKCRRLTTNGISPETCWSYITCLTRRTPAWHRTKPTSLQDTTELNKCASDELPLWLLCGSYIISSSKQAQASHRDLAGTSGRRAQFCAFSEFTSVNQHLMSGPGHAASPLHTRFPNHG